MASAPLTALFLAAASPLAVLADEHVRLGDRLEARDLPTLEGGRAALLSARARANVLAFFRPDQEYSREVLRHAAGWSRDFAGKPVHIVAIASSRRPAAEVRRAVEGAGLKVPVLVDEDDRLYAELGLRTLPVVVVADGDFRVVAFETFRKLNLDATVRARIRLALNEIDAEAVDRAANPPRATMPNEVDGAVAHRNIRLGQMLLERGHHQEAAERARHVLALDPRYAPAHVLLGQALAAQRRCDEAVRAFEEALRLEPGNAAAVEGKAGCEPAPR
ncbi:MAG TPA: tetratricopeptide repeat protein [Anaeromyxobacteraceae bacterium]|nr:tetratricopeptide repeat protein [Anaeromyxobacteraceae bacterium]